ncbi:MAG: HlyD family type I secretion periplasmic adaptor subunit [Candidatus Sedimenticola sp. 20ELBAFRAG]
MTETNDKPTDEPVLPQTMNDRRGAVSGHDLEFMSDASAAVLIKTPRGGRLILWMAAVFIIAALTWANWAELDEVTTGVGKVIPSSQVQVVQNLEGGIVGALLVKEGQTVDKGQVLLQIDDTRFSSSLRETRLQFLALKAKSARLRSEAEGTEFKVPGEIASEAPEIVAEERSLYKARSSQLENSKSILSEQVAQRDQELRELNAKRSQLRRSLNLVRKELTMTKPLVSAGAISEVEVLRLERQVNELEGDLQSTTLSIPRVRSQLDEAQKKADEVELRFQSEAREQLNEVSAEVSRLQESSVTLKDRVQRTAVRSPVHGTVKQILISTVGGVIQPGMELVEIVPLEDTLLIEAKISPKDIGFLSPGQKTIVKFTAYDFAIFGGLDGKLEQISPDTIKDENDETYYQVRVRTDRNYLGSEVNSLQIISGMQTEVDIVTGKKTVLQYLLKPVLRAKEKALRER